MKQISFLLVLLSVLLWACVPENTDTGDKSANLSSFSISDTLYLEDVEYDLSAITFTVDNDTPVDYFNNGELYYLIYNADSAAMNADKRKVVLTYSGSTITSSVMLTATDTISYTGADSLNLKDTVRIHTLATDARTTRQYVVDFRVHKVDPELYIWKHMPDNSHKYPVQTKEEKAFCVDTVVTLYMLDQAGNLSLERFVDESRWETATITGLPTSISTIDKMYQYDDGLGLVVGSDLYVSENGIAWTKKEGTVSLDYGKYLFEINGKHFASYLNNDGSISVASSSDMLTWTISTVSLPLDTPTEGFDAKKFLTNSGREVGYIMGGRNSSGYCGFWSTEDGMYWSKISPIQTGLSGRLDASIVRYDGKILSFGGNTTGGQLVADQYLQSNDYGYTWSEFTEKIMPAIQFPRRKGAFAVTSADGKYIYVVGGKDVNGGFIKDCYRGMKLEVIVGE